MLPSTAHPSSRRWRTRLAAGLALGLLVGVGDPGGTWPGPATPANAAPAGASAPDPTGQRAPGADGPVTVTLITGDRVTVRGKAASVRPGPGRQGIGFQVRREGGALTVVPRDAARLVRAGTLDPRLFDVTGLLRDGYADPDRNTLPLLVSHADATADRVDRTVTATGARVTRQLPAIDGAAVTVDKPRAGAFWSGVTTGTAGLRTDTTGGIGRIWLDGRRRILLDHSVPQIGAPEAWRAGWTGRGETVAVLDTGIDTTHPDLVGRVAESRNFTEEASSGDVVGHGTHVASIIAGSGTASGGRYRGVAPDATLLSGKVCEMFGCPESAILAGMRWAAVEKRATVVNLSLGGPDGPGVDPLEQAVNSLTAQTGTLFVIAAGNDGADGSVGSPGSADAALTVGAVDRDDDLAEFSSRGPRVDDDAVKPDITAPGVDIVAARSADGWIGEPVGDRYVRLSGTSMATPHVVGSVALLAQQHPDWTAARLKATLMASARPNPALGAYQQGAGRVDVGRAVAQTVTTDPPSVSFGRTIWPHADDPSIARTVDYRNTGAAPVSLELTVQATGPGGVSAPAGMFRLDTDRITVPAGGSTRVTVTADTRVGGPDGHWTGRLVATGGGTTVGTPFAVSQEVESYDVTLAHLDATGAPATDYWTVLVDLASGRSWSPYEADGTVLLRLPKGTYALAGSVDTGRARAALSRSALTVDRAVTLVVDARKAHPVRMTVPDPSVRPALIDVGTTFRTAAWSVSVDMLLDTFDGLSTGGLGQPSPDHVTAHVATQWARPAPDGTFDESPDLYAVGERFAGGLPDGLVRDYRHRDLATVEQQFRSGGPDQLAMRAVFAELGDVWPWSPGLLGNLPGRRTERYLARVAWSSFMLLGVRAPEGWLDEQSMLDASPTRYRTGRTHREQWNGAPLGPSLPVGRGPYSGVTREGDIIRVDVPVFSDAAGHAGRSLTDTARTVLYRNGRLVDTVEAPGVGEFPVPSGRATYRLETSATRSVSDLSTRTDVVWTFRSGHVGGGDPVGLPVMAVRFAPLLDATNTAPAGQRANVPVAIEWQPGTKASRVRSLTVQVSYDDGGTWRDVRVRPGRSGWVAELRHPADAGHVSLRAKAVADGGVTVTQTLTHAYRLR